MGVGCRCGGGGDVDGAEDSSVEGSMSRAAAGEATFGGEGPTSDATAAADDVDEACKGRDGRRRRITVTE